MDRLRIIYHPAKAPDRTGTPVATEPVVLGSDPDFAIRWIRRRLGLRPRGVFPLTTRYRPDILPLRDPAAMITTSSADGTLVRPDRDHVPAPSLPAAPSSSVPPPAPQPDSGAALPAMANTQINEPETALPISDSSPDELDNDSLPVPILDDER